MFWGFFLTVLVKHKIRLFMVDLIRDALISHTLMALGREVAIAKSNSAVGNTS